MPRTFFMRAYALFCQQMSTDVLCRFYAARYMKRPERRLSPLLMRCFMTPDVSAMTPAPRRVTPPGVRQHIFYVRTLYVTHIMVRRHSFAAPRCWPPSGFSAASLRPATPPGSVL